MQDIATTKSEFAALPSKIQTFSEDNRNGNFEFRALLQEVKPLYHQPVEPRTEQVERASSPEHIERKVSRQTSPAQPRNVEQHRQPRAGDDSRQGDTRDTDNKTDKYNVRENTSSTLSASEQQKAANKERAADAESTEYEQVKTAHQSNIKDQPQSGSERSAYEAEQHAGSEKTNSDEIIKQGLGEEQQQIALASLVPDPLHNIAQQQDTSDKPISTEGESIDGLVGEVAEPAQFFDWLGLLEKSKSTELAQSISHALNSDPQAKADTDLSNLLGKQSADGAVNGVDLSLRNSLNVSSELGAANTSASAGDETNLVIEQHNVTLPVAGTDNLSPLEQLLGMLEKIQPVAVQDSQGEAGGLALEGQMDDLQVALQKLLDALAGEGSQGGLDNQTQIDSSIISTPTDLLGNKPTALTTENTNQASTSSEPSEYNANLALIANLLRAEQGRNLEESKPQHTEQVNTATLADLGAKQARTDAAAKQASTVTSADPDLVRMLEFPAEKLDIAINNLAQRLGLGDETAAPQNSQFVAAIKSGLEEFKAQLKQGHQPAIDFNALVAQTMEKVSVADINMEKLGATLNRFNQTLEITSQLSAKSDVSHLLTMIEKTSARESQSQSVLLSNKQSQQQVAQFDKAVNITRNEGLQQMTEKVRWMVSQNNLQADIRLDPPDLGSMKVRVSMSGDTATVNIVVQSQQARDVLDQAAPRLREMLEQQGIELGQSSVQQEQNETAEQQGDSQFAQSSQSPEDMTVDESLVAEQKINNGRIGGIDYFV
ncbi:flagellar hook-length control protein FliK [Aliiglaciecola sp. LCG003]|uniref:flagellar hook-length control protein FliK n=1 Tax=Aliiglaciecola sp. LCG003 TaxID=3053655 RepID=UPI0025736AF6|nr:flagellar hook-length control protein FliK [Aliiglaciecola sp. LCG003]WJG10612.1 flagellar hook-length control protein FliK [Aliiglaciecola sp. LCG003]